LATTCGATGRARGDCATFEREIWAALNVLDEIEIDVAAVTAWDRGARGMSQRSSRRPVSPINGSAWWRFGFRYAQEMAVRPQSRASDQSIYFAGLARPWRSTQI
jgi:hypothetical protein